MERPDISITGTLPVYAYAVTEGAVGGLAIGLIVTGGSVGQALWLGALGAPVGLALARWYLPRVRGGE